MDRGTSELNNKVCDLHQQEQLLIIPIRDCHYLQGGGLVQQSVCHVWFFLRTRICKVKIFAPPPVPMSPQLHIFDTVYIIKYTMYLRTVGLMIPNIGPVFLNKY